MRLQNLIISINLFFVVIQQGDCKMWPVGRFHFLSIGLMFTTLTPLGINPEKLLVLVSIPVCLNRKYQSVGGCFSMSC